MFHPIELEGLVAIMFSLAIPIFAIVMGISKSIKKNENERIIREAIINNHTDPETAQLLIQNQEPKSNKFTALRWGCVLLGIGLGAAVNFLLNLSAKDDIYFWLILAAGCGIGFLVSFIVEMKMQQREKEQHPDSDI